MFAKDIVEYDILPLKLDATVEAAKQAMDTHKTCEIPILDDTGCFAGIISETDILDSQQAGKAHLVNAIPLSRIHASPSQHVHEVFEIMCSNNLSIIPVVDIKNTLIGTITLAGLSNFLADAIGMRKQGAVFIIKTKESDYSMSQICHIIESNGAKIISILTSNISSDITEITVKVNILDVTSIIQSLNRYDYSVETLNAQTEIMDMMIKSRIDNLLNFINM